MTAETWASPRHGSSGETKRMKTIGEVAGATGVLAALGGEFLATATAVSIGLAGVLAVLLLVLAIGSWDELNTMSTAAEVI